MSSCQASGFMLSGAEGRITIVISVGRSLPTHREAPFVMWDEILAELYG